MFCEVCPKSSVLHVLLVLYSVGTHILKISALFTYKTSSFVLKGRPLLWKTRKLNSWIRLFLTFVQFMLFLKKEKMLKSRFLDAISFFNLHITVQLIWSFLMFFDVPASMPPWDNNVLPCLPPLDENALACMPPLDENVFACMPPMDENVIVCLPPLVENFLSCMLPRDENVLPCLPPLHENVLACMSPCMKMF